MFRRQLFVDDATWVRGLWKALLQLRESRRTESARAAESLRVLNDILSE